MTITMFVRDVVPKPFPKQSTDSTRSPTHNLLFKLMRLVTDEMLSWPGSCQEDKDGGTWPIFAALTLARSLVASSMFGPEELCLVFG